MPRKCVAVLIGLMLGLATVGCQKSTAVVSPKHRVTTGLRGVVLAKLSCSAKPKAPNAGTVPISGVEGFLLCRTGLRGVARSPLTVTPTDAQFARLVTALSAPSAPPTTGACPELSEAEIVLLARTHAGAFRVSIPVDNCGLYQQAAVAAIYGAPGTTTGIAAAAQSSAL